jgi:hypothetical protein
MISCCWQNPATGPAGTTIVPTVCDATAGQAGAFATVGGADQAEASAGAMRAAANQPVVASSPITKMAVNSFFRAISRRRLRSET